ncbi:MAG TPA: hypothetical protein VFU55_03070 [Terracidiphilus sp.]|nr:hypothetical protein [Terracidiphilus sp.]
MKKIALVALAMLIVPAGLAFAETKPKATHPPVVKHHIDKSKIGRHAKPNHPKALHAKNNHPKAVHPANQHLNEVHPRKASDTTASHEANKTALKASKKHHKFHLF